MASIHAPGTGAPDFRETGFRETGLARGLLAVMAVAGTLAGTLAGTGAEASPVGTPLFTTAPATIFITNEFGTDLFPTDSFSVSVTTTIGSADGAPNLVGETLVFHYFIDNGFAVSPTASLVIDGVETMFDPLLFDGQFLFGPPVDTAVFDPGTGNDIFTYDAPFDDFGPRTDIFPEILFEFLINDPLPTRTGFEYVTAGGDIIFDNTPGITSFGSSPDDAVVSSTEITYTEGTISGGTITFFTVGGPPPATVPLPAGLWLMLGGLGTAGLLARRRSRVL